LGQVLAYAYFFITIWHFKTLNNYLKRVDEQETA
jgi:hypothetical protein